jgi:hypothetical protein
MTTGIYEFHADMSVPSITNDASPEDVIAMERSVSEDMALIGLSVGAGLEWFPASSEYPEGEAYASQEGRAPQRTIHGVVMTPEASEQLLRISRTYFGLPEDERLAIFGAMEWIRLGLVADASLIKFLCQYIAIEKMASWWWKRNNLARSADDILDSLRPLRGIQVRDDGIFIEKRDSWDFVFSRIEALSQQLNTSVAIKVEKAFELVFGLEKAKASMDRLSEGDPSARRLRNDVAHGNVDEATIPERSRLEGLVWTVTDIARDFVFESIERLPKANS